MFSQSGYHAASIDDIAREAGVSKALIYEHFASKQELLRRPDRAERPRAHPARRRARSSGVEIESSVERLATGLEAFFAFVEERRDAWRMLFRDAADPESAAVLDRMLEQVTAEVTLLISQDPGARELDSARAAGARGCSRRCSWAARSRWRTGGRDIPRRPARRWSRSPWTSRGSGSSGSAAASAGRRLNELRRVRSWTPPTRRGSRSSRSGADGERREISFGEVADRSARMAGALAARGVGRGDVVMTVVGNRPEWAYAMLACWRLGAVAQPCAEQLRPADLRARDGDGASRGRGGRRARPRTSWRPAASTVRCSRCPTRPVRARAAAGAEFAAEEPGARSSSPRGRPVSRSPSATGTAT